MENFIPDLVNGGGIIPDFHGQGPAYITAADIGLDSDDDDPLGLDRFMKPCVDCGQLTNNWCDGERNPYDPCRNMFRDNDPNEEPSSTLPFCDFCETLRSVCHHCYKRDWVQPPQYHMQLTYPQMPRLTPRKGAQLIEQRWNNLRRLHTDAPNARIYLPTFLVLKPCPVIPAFIENGAKQLPQPYNYIMTNGSWNRPLEFPFPQMFNI